MDPHCHSRSNTIVPKDDEKPSSRPLEFMFIVAGTGDRTSNDATRSAARSHITRIQHRQLRQANRFRPMDGKAGSSKCRTKATKNASSNECADRREDESAATLPATRQTENPNPINAIDLPNRGTTSHTFVTGAAAFQVFQLSDRENLVGACLTEMTTDLAGIVDMFGSMYDGHNPELLDRLVRPVTLKGPSLRQDFMPFIFTHPALLAAGLLTSASLMIVARGQNPSRLYPLLKLRGFVLDQIQSHIGPDSNPPEGRGISDAVIAAVIFMAKYEASFGTSKNHNVHMRGLVHMVNLRGGLAELGLDGLLAQIILWFDDSTAGMLGTSTFYQHDVRNRSTYAANMMTTAALAQSDRPL